MAEDGGGRGGAPAPKAADPPSRPTIALPQRHSYESLFRGSGGGGGVSDVSPGPMTLVSSFFAEDPDSDCRSFSQLLAGAMASPAAPPSSRSLTFPAEERPRVPWEKGDPGGVGGANFRHNQPLSLMVSQSPFFTVPPGLSPAGLLESPAPAAFFSSSSGHFGISHQQALAQVTAQAHPYVHNQAENSYSLPTAAAMTATQPNTSAINMEFIQQMPLRTSDVDNTTFDSAEDSHCDQRSHPTALIVDKPADDGYNWRKYGQKQVKGSEYPRSYYKCTHPSCVVKKKVERSHDGHVTEIIYKGQHNHQRPTPNRRGKESGTFPSGSNELSTALDFPANSKTVLKSTPENFSRSDDTLDVPLISKRERESGHGSSEQWSGSNDGEEVGDAELRTDEGDDNETDLKRRKIDTGVMESTSSQRAAAEPRIIVQTTSEVDLLDDGYRWRKYGQKVVKGNPNPRSYYKCTNVGCKVRKHVERASTDNKAVITTYEGKHNHDLPAARNNSHNTATAGAVSNSVQPKVHNTITSNQSLFKRTGFGNNNVQQPGPAQLKEEQDIL